MATDDQPVTSAAGGLTQDQRAVAIRDLRQVVMASSMLIRHLEKDPATPPPHDFAGSALRSAELALFGATKALGVTTDTSEEIAQRFQALRTANDEIQRLSAALACGASVAQTKAHLPMLAAGLRRWWEAEGFSYIRTISFDEYSHVTADLGFSLGGRFIDSISDTPVTNQDERAAGLDRRLRSGFILERLDDGEDQVLVDCDVNRSAIGQLIARDLPSARIWRTETRHAKGKGYLMSVEAHILDIEDIARLQARFPA